MYDNEINGESFLLDLCKKAAKVCAFTAQDLNELKLWQALTKKTLFDTLGLNKITADNSSAILIESTKLSSYRRDKYLLPTASNLKMPLYVLVPNECNGKAMLALHGHGSCGKEGVAGTLDKEAYDNPQVAAYGEELAKKGYLTICPDLLGNGERAVPFAADPKKSICDALNNPLVALGLSLQGVILFELLRLVDFSLSLEENKYTRLGVVGFSGGGLFSLLLSAICDKIELCVVSGYFHTRHDTCLQSNKCGCNFAYNIWNTIDCGELAALVAPRPLFIELGKADKLHGRSGINSVYSQFETANKAYTICDKQNALELVLCDGAHRWYGECYSFIDKNFI